MSLFNDYIMNNYMFRPVLVIFERYFEILFLWMNKKECAVIVTSNMALLLWSSMWISHVRLF